MKLRYNYRIYPTSEQEQAMSQAGGYCRWLWNKLLEMNLDLYDQEKKF